jgi:hypothetical protein
MSNAEKDLNDLKNKLDTGLKLTFKKLLREKKARNGSFVFSKNGKIITVKASDIEHT